MPWGNATGEMQWRKCNGEKCNAGNDKDVVVQMEVLPPPLAQCKNVFVVAGVVDVAGVVVEFSFLVTFVLFRRKSCHRPWHTGLKTFGEIECLRPDKGQRRRKVTRKPKSTTTTRTTTTTPAPTTTSSQATTT